MVGEVREEGVEEESEDVGEGWGVDKIGCFVEEAAQGFGCCGCAGVWGRLRRVR